MTTRRKVVVCFMGLNVALFFIGLLGVRWAIMAWFCSYPVALIAAVCVSRTRAKE